MAKTSPRFLSQMLILSIALNVSLLATFIFVATREKEIPLSPPPTPTTHETNPPLTNSHLLHEYIQASYHQLLSLLPDDHLVEQGYTKRDLVLGCLVTFYHFNIEKALGSTAPQSRTFLLTHPKKTEKIPFHLFPGLTDCHYQAILHFLQTEKWPFTSFGIYQLIKRSHPFPDPTLIEAFSHTPECRTITTLFTKSGMHIESEPLIQMLTQGKWELIESFYTQQRLLPDLTSKRRRIFILDYLEEYSPLAARIFIEADAEFAAARLSDDRILLLFDLYPKQTPYLEAFAKALLQSPRSDSVWKKASSKLNLPFPKDTPPQPTETSTYTVQDGDSLWKIAHKFDTTIDALMEHNHLDTETIHPNTTLNIP